MEETVEFAKTAEEALFAKTNTAELKEREGNFNEPLHQSNYELFRKKKYNEYEFFDLV
jgi:hypothetical protein